MKMYDKLIRTIDIAIYNGKLYYIFRPGVLGLISNSFYYYIFKEFYHFFSLWNYILVIWRRFNKSFNILILSVFILANIYIFL